MAAPPGAAADLRGPPAVAWHDLLSAARTFDFKLYLAKHYAPPPAQEHSPLHFVTRLKEPGAQPHLRPVQSF